MAHVQAPAAARLLEHLAVRSDPLTGLAGRQLFRDQLDHDLRSGAPVAVLFADLDGFARVNEAYGPAAADTLLVDAAARVDEVVAGSGLAARLGGDDFALVLPGAGEAVAAGLVAALARPYVLDPGLALTVSVGLAVTTQGRRDAGELLRGADLALRAAKDAGGGRWTGYTEALLADLRGRLTIEPRLSA